MAQQETASRSVTTKSPVAAYSFSDPAATGMRFADRSGNRGLAVGQNVRRAKGRFGAGLAFNGKSSSLTVAGRPVLDLDDAMTLLAWVKPQSARGTRTIVARLGRGGATYAVHAATARGGPGGEARLARGTKRVSVPDDLPLGKWTHVALTYDGSRLRLYENADEISSVAVAGSIRDAKGPLRIGGRVPGGGWFKGVLDEVRVYNRALSAAEIRRGMRGGAPDKPAPAAPPPAPAPSPSGVAAPAGDLPGWRQIFIDDFTRDAASWGECDSVFPQLARTCSGLPEPYRSTWWAYPSHYEDSREQQNGDGGFYQASDMYMSGGQLHLPLSRVNGTSRSQAPVPEASIARTYGRFSLRARSDSSPNFKVAWLMWREVTDWGAILFPEADLDDDGLCAVNAAMDHGDAFKRCVDSPDFSDGNWHTYTTEWTPGRLRFYVDGILFGETTNQVPSTAMTWIIQSETRLSGTLQSNAAPIEIDIDWVAIWAPA